VSRVLRLGPPFDPRLLDALAGQVVPWSGVVWRLVLRGTGPLTANSRGARWNSSEFEAVYFSLDPRAANAELDYLLARQPVPIVAARQLYRF
jgi:RES domain-containing protein